MLSAGSHEHPLAMACELGAHLTKHLRLLQEPLKHLPLAVWRAEGSERESFVFPTSTGLWVMGQKATEASVFLMSHLLEHHKQLLTKGQVRLLTTSTPFLQSLLRCLKPNLPRKDAIIRSQAAVAHTSMVGSATEAVAASSSGAGGGVSGGGGLPPHTLRLGPVSLRPGQEVRQFVAVPAGATWAELMVRADDYDTPRVFLIRCGAVVCLGSGTEGDDAGR